MIPADHEPGSMRDALDLAARYAAARPPLGGGLVHELQTAVITHRDVRVRAAALGALVRGGARDRARTAWAYAARDPMPAVRRRAAELAPALAPPPVVRLIALLSDPDAFVAETAAWALGEVAWDGRTRSRVVNALASATTANPDPLVRESAVAALGSIGDDRGLPAVLAACADRPPIRRRAVLALAPFEGPDVDAALERALADTDWQVRQAAEDLRGVD
ncbi:MAG: HEAT repeat domain-containing protein [Acidimicrobiia bacterium]